CDRYYAALDSKSHSAGIEPERDSAQSDHRGDAVVPEGPTVTRRSHVNFSWGSRERRALTSTPVIPQKYMRRSHRTAASRQLPPERPSFASVVPASAALHLVCSSSRQSRARRPGTSREHQATNTPPPRLCTLWRAARPTEVQPLRSCKSELRSTSTQPAPRS